jgi:tRNA(Arg) A34 adenosine deaminase TadA
MDEFMQAAIEEAKKGLSEGGIPIGSVLVTMRGRAALRMHARFGHAKHRDALQAERSAAQKVTLVFRLALAIRSIESLSPDFYRHEK